jgi:hypothetical protein
VRSKPSRPIAKFTLLLLATTGSCAMSQTQDTSQQQTPPSPPSAPAPQSTADLLKALDQVVDQNKKLTEQNQQLMEKVEELRQQVEAANPTIATAEAAKAAAQLTASEQEIVSDEGTTSKTDLAIEESQPHPKTWGTYTPNFGYEVANTPYGDLSVSIYSYGRYLNQRAVDATYTNYFGVTSTLQQRQDFQLNKVQMKFLGWLYDPRFRYFLYAWTSNSSQGLGAQTVLAGNLNYTFTKWLTIGAGVYGLPGVRSLEGNFPFWYSVDARIMAEEFFRPAYSQGIIGRGNIIGDKLSYQVMDANNLSALGVSAAQLPNTFSTVASALVWLPQGDFGAGYGDFEDHQSVVTRLAGHYTRSRATKESQPQTDQFENTQIRLEDGTVVFTPNIFGPGIAVNTLKYQMMNVDAGIKYRGWDLSGTYYQRWLSQFTGAGIGPAGLPEVVSRGLYVGASKMLIPRSLMLVVMGSSIYGKYGNPYDLRVALNYYPFKNRVIRWNNEVLYLDKSATGNNTLPYTVGNTGPIFDTTLEVAF